MVERRKGLAAAVESTVMLPDESVKHPSGACALPATTVRVEADPVRLAQVFANLLNNAAKYTERSGNISLTVEVQAETELIKVQDNGIGIAADRLTQVFEMFVQLDHSLERAQGGLGIGLTLVKRLVLLHGGTIDIHSEGQGRGTEVVVRLPILTT